MRRGRVCSGSTSVMSMLRKLCAGVRLGRRSVQCGRGNGFGTIKGAECHQHNRQGRYRQVVLEEQGGRAWSPEGHLA